MIRLHALGAAFLASWLWTAPHAAPPDTPVADAAQRGDVAAVRALVREGADVNAAQGDGMTALHWAALNGNVSMIKVLLYAGANVEPTTRIGGYTPLDLASKEGLADAVRTLLEAGSKPNAFTTTGVSALHFAAEAGRADAIRVLLEHGADANAADGFSHRTPLMFAVASNRLEAIDVLLKAGADVKAVTKVVDYAERSRSDDAARRRRARVIAAAKDPAPRERAAGAPAPGGRGAPAADTTQDKPGTGDARAASPGDTASRQNARAAAPDPDSPTAPGEPRGGAPGRSSGGGGGYGQRSLSYEDWVGKQGGMTALHYAARDGHVEAARRLLEAGADINQVTSGDQTSPLLIAVINGNFDLAMELLQRGADPNLASDDGAAPLFAVLNNEWALRTWYPQPTASQQQKTPYLDLLEALLKAGADPNARLKTHIWYAAYNAGRMGVDYSGATAFWRAAYALDVNAMRLLVTYGADPNIPTIKPAQGRFPGAANRSRDSTEADEPDKSGLPPVPVGGPGVYPLHAASGVGYGTSRVGQQHRHVPDGWLAAVRYLVDELHADVNVRDFEGYTALHNAAARGDNDVIKYLVEHGADVAVVSRRGQTTVDMANGPQQRVQPFPDTIALLEGLGAKNNHKCQSCE